MPIRVTAWRPTSDEAVWASLRIGGALQVITKALGNRSWSLIRLIPHCSSLHLVDLQVSSCSAASHSQHFPYSDLGCNSGHDLSKGGRWERLRLSDHGRLPLVASFTNARVDGNPPQKWNVYLRGHSLGAAVIRRCHTTSHSLDR